MKNLSNLILSNYLVYDFYKDSPICSLTIEKELQLSRFELSVSEEKLSKNKHTENIIIIILFPILFMDV